MSIKIKREPFLKQEKLYRKLTAASFFEAVATLISAAVIVPLFASETSYWVMILYGLLFFIFCLDLLASSAAGFFSAKATGNETFIVQGVLHLVSFALAMLNAKLFAAIFLFGIKQDALAEKLTGTDTDAFVENASKNWSYLLIALIISAVLCVLALLKLAKEHKYSKGS